MSLFSRGAIFVCLDDQENIICALPLHIATRTVGAICERNSMWLHIAAYRAPAAVVAICERNSMWLHIAAS